MQRVSKRFCPEDFLLTLLTLLDAVSTGRASINQLVVTLGKHAPTQQISSQPCTSGSTAPNAAWKASSSFA